MNQDEKKIKEELSAHITLPSCVEEKMQEAYQEIQKGKLVNVKKERYRMKKWVAVAAAAVLTCTTTFGVWAAATGFFSKEVVDEGDKLSYQFEVDYDLVPGEYEVEPSYIPSGFVETDKGYGTEDHSEGISIMVLTTSALDVMGDLDVYKEYIDGVEHTELSGMEADVITYEEKQKLYNNIFMFNEKEGYVVQLFSSPGTPIEEAKKFADGLKVTRVGDGAYETAEEKAKRESTEQADKEWFQEQEARIEKGLKADELLSLGETATVETVDSNGMSYKAEEFTVVDAVFTDSVAEYAKDAFFDYSELEPWLNEDGTLKPYIREQWAEETSEYEKEVIKEEEVNQQFLVVKARVKKLGIDSTDEFSKEVSKDTPLNARLINLVDREDGSYTLSSNVYYPADRDNTIAEDYPGTYAIFFDQPEFTEPDVRNHFFFRTMDTGDTLEYTLIFVVDKDKKDQLFLEFDASQPYFDSNFAEEPMIFSLQK